MNGGQGLSRPNPSGSRANPVGESTQFRLGTRDGKPTRRSGFLRRRRSGFAIRGRPESRSLVTLALSTTGLRVGRAVV